MKWNGTLLLTEKQVKRILKGHHIKLLRDRKWYTIGMKPKNTEELKIKKKIEAWKIKLHKLKFKQQ